MKGPAPKARTGVALTPEKHADAARLREDIAELDSWIKTRSKELERTLDEHIKKARHLVIVSASADELNSEYKRTEELKKEIKSLNELRQIRELKKAILHKLESIERD
jgi:hypothetical protein